MMPNVANREVPVLVVRGPDGPEMVNYRVKGDIYIVDAPCSNPLRRKDTSWTDRKSVV